MNLLYNQAGRLRSGWRFAIFLLALLVLGVIIGGIVAATAAVASPELRQSVRLIIGGKAGFLIQWAMMLIASLGVGWLCARVLEDLPFRSLGASFTNGWWRDFALGSVAGAATLLLAAFIITALGGFRFAFNYSASGTAIITTLTTTFVIFFLGAAAEEALFRGYMLQTFLRSHKVLIAALPSALLFGYVHLDNPNIAAGWTFINTALAGVWLAMAYLKTRNLWFPTGVHLSWNWTMASVLGIPVSGITSIAPQPLFRASETGADWFTGGTYGIEGGAVCTFALIVSTVFIWRTKWLRADEDLLALTSRENANETDGISIKQEMSVD
ncbi:MAG: CPBP family intramembrane metalloprotease [Pyrinomonadaceae bacterium MAG19_C2-C3]|nr:CPBP family intramembrane metalloprotease [Pyrinomonadaceae bacterium MAG19_C2-C3]